MDIAIKKSDVHSNLCISFVHTTDYTNLKTISKRKDISITKMLNDCILEIIRVDAEENPGPVVDNTYVPILINSIPKERKKKLQEIAKRKGMHVSALLKPCIFQIIRENKHLLR